MNYALKFDMKSHKVTLTRNNPFSQLVVWTEEINQLSEGVFIKIVIRFIKDKFKIWIHPDEDSTNATNNELNKENQLADFMYESELYNKFTIQDAGIKEGKIGWFCSHCKGLIIRQAVLYADACINEDKVNPFHQLISPYTLRYKEDFTFKFS